MANHEGRGGSGDVLNISLREFRTEPSAIVGAGSRHRRSSGQVDIGIVGNGLRQS